MKTPPLSLLNSLGFTTDNYAQLAAYCAHLLQAATQSSPTYTISAAQPAKPAKPEIKAQPAHPAYPARPARTAAQNTTGYIFGELYLNSPAYPAGTPIPAIPAKLATAAVAYQAAVPATPAVPAKIAPEIKALDGFSDAITIVNDIDTVTIEAYIPTRSNLQLLGINNAGFFEDLLEITPSNLQTTVWFGNKASDNPGNLVDNLLLPTVERMLLGCAWMCANTGNYGRCEDAVRSFGGKLMRCKKITIKIAASMAKGYSPIDGILHLEAFDYYPDPLLNNGSGSIVSPGE